MMSDARSVTLGHHDKTFEGVVCGASRDSGHTDGRRKASMTASACPSGDPEPEERSSYKFDCGTRGESR